MNQFQKSEIEHFQINHKQSKTLWDRSVNLFPGGINHNIRNLGLPLLDLYPVYIKNSHMIQLTDVDDNNYTDYWLGHYSQILGHNNPVIRQKIDERLQHGWMTGTVIEEQVQLAEKITSISKNIDKVRFQTSGSESVMNAIRLARAYTKRDVIAKVDLGYHGANSLTANGSIPKLTEVEDSESVTSQKIVSFHLEQTFIERLFKEFGKKLACIIIEPVLGGGGGAIQVDLELLKFLREQCNSYGVVLIFDEVVSGYRFQYGLYQDKIKLYADLTSLGKIIGGGFAVGGLGGLDEIMDLANPSTNRLNKITIGGGTFSGHPITMSAGLATLNLLEAKKDAYADLNKLGDYLQEQLNRIFQESNKNYISTNYGSLIFISALKKNPWENGSINKLEIMNTIDPKEQALLQLFLLNRNIYGYHGLGSLSFSHTKQDADYVISVIQKFLNN